MRDVASSAGVSLKTVSRVVNAETGVRQETAQRVEAAIAKLGFRPNELASGLRAGRAGALGLIIEDVSNPFYSEITRAVEEAASERGHLLLTGSCGEDPEHERDLVLRFLRRAVDALLLVPAGRDHRYLLPDLAGGQPIVFLDRPPGGVEADAVLADNRGGAVLAVEHLLAYGHRRIAVLADADHIFTAQERLAGYADALAGAGVAPDSQLVRTGLHDADTAGAAVRDLFALPPGERPTALFCANNRITIGALRASYAAGEHLALVGFDDFELADLLATPVTVVRQSPSEIARLAAETAYARLDGDEGLPRPPRRPLPARAARIRRDTRMKPTVLPPNPVARFYRGGPAIAALRGVPPGGDRVPEDWVGSTTEVLGDPSAGPSRLADGRLLRDAIAEDPDGWLGPDHVARWGADPAVLVKLLDAGERLPVHLHPDGPFARERLGTRFGKTEAWIVIGGEGYVALGWREPVDPETLRDWVERQDAAAMLAALHRIDLEPGDAVFVPAGVPHSIGEGLLIAELQEPSDMSIMLEWRGHGIADEREATLALGWDTALTAATRDAIDPATLAAPPGDDPVRDLMPPAADPFFRAQALRVEGAPVELEPSFAVLLVIDGEGRLDVPGADELSLRRGDNVVVPHAAGATHLSGALRAVRCLPPRPGAPEVPSR